MFNSGLKFSVPSHPICIVRYYTDTTLKDHFRRRDATCGVSSVSALMEKATAGT